MNPSNGSFGGAAPRPTFGASPPAFGGGGFGAAPAPAAGFGAPAGGAPAGGFGFGAGGGFGAAAPPKVAWGFGAQGAGQGAPARKPVSERTQEGGAPLSQPPAQAAAPAQAQRGASVFNRLGAGSAGSSIAAGRTGGAAAGGGSTNVSQRLSRQSVLAALEAKRGRGGAVRGRRSSSGVQGAGLGGLPLARGAPRTAGRGAPAGFGASLPGFGGLGRGGSGAFGRGGGGVFGSGAGASAGAEAEQDVDDDGEEEGDEGEGMAEEQQEEEEELDEAALEAERQAALAAMPSFQGSGGGGGGAMGVFGGKAAAVPAASKPPRPAMSALAPAAAAAATAALAPRVHAPATAPRLPPTRAAAPTYAGGGEAGGGDDAADDGEIAGLVPTCEDMCPAVERQEREESGSLHTLERVDPSDPYHTTAALAVKKHQRSSAGATFAPERVRTWGGLQRTMDHLRRLYDRSTVSLLSRESFIFDRYRAVRKDMHQQGLAGKGREQLAWCISALEEMARWHIGMDAELAGDDKANMAAELAEEQRAPVAAVTFVEGAEAGYGHDPRASSPAPGSSGREWYEGHLHTEETAKTLVDLLALYAKARSVGLACPCEGEMVAYQLLLLGAHHGKFKPPPTMLVKLLSSLTEETLASPHVAWALRLLHALRQGNWVAFLNAWEAAPYMLAAVAQVHLPTLRSNVLYTLLNARSPERLDGSRRGAPPTRVLPLVDFATAGRFADVAEAARFAGQHAGVVLEEVVLAGQTLVALLPATTPSLGGRTATLPFRKPDPMPRSPLPEMAAMRGDASLAELFTTPCPAPGAAGALGAGLVRPPLRSGSFSLAGRPAASPGGFLADYGSPYGTSSPGLGGAAAAAAGPAGSGPLQPPRMIAPAALAPAPGGGIGTGMGAATAAAEAAAAQAEQQRKEKEEQAERLRAAEEAAAQQRLLLQQKQQVQAQRLWQEQQAAAAAAAEQQRQQAAAAVAAEAAARRAAYERACAEEAARRAAAEAAERARREAEEEAARQQALRFREKCTAAGRWLVLNMWLRAAQHRKAARLRRQREAAELAACALPLPKPAGASHASMPAAPVPALPEPREGQQEKRRRVDAPGNAAGPAAAVAGQLPLASLVWRALSTSAEQGSRGGLPHHWYWKLVLLSGLGEAGELAARVAQQPAAHWLRQQLAQEGLQFAPQCGAAGAPALVALPAGSSNGGAGGSGRGSGGHSGAWGVGDMELLPCTGAANGHSVDSTPVPAWQLACGHILALSQQQQQQQQPQQPVGGRSGGAAPATLTLEVVDVSASRLVTQEPPSSCRASDTMAGTCALMLLAAGPTREEAALVARRLAAALERLPQGLRLPVAVLAASGSAADLGALLDAELQSCLAPAERAKLSACGAFALEGPAGEGGQAALAEALTFLASSSPRQPLLQRAPLHRLLRGLLDVALPQLAASDSHPVSYVDTWNAYLSELEGLAAAAAQEPSARWRFPPPELGGGRDAADGGAGSAPGAAAAAALRALRLPPLRHHVGGGRLQQALGYLGYALPEHLAPQAAEALAAAPAIQATMAGAPAAQLRALFGLLFQQLAERLASLPPLLLPPELAVACTPLPARQKQQPHGRRPRGAAAAAPLPQMPLSGYARPSAAQAVPQQPLLQLPAAAGARAPGKAAATAAGGVNGGSQPQQQQQEHEEQGDGVQCRDVLAASASALDEALALAGQFGISLPLMAGGGML